MPFQGYSQLISQCLVNVLEKTILPLTPKQIVFKEVMVIILLWWTIIYV
jgi:hypothetical protein